MLADAVLAELVTEDMLRAAARQMLPQYVADMLRDSRNRTISGRPSVSEDTPAAKVSGRPPGWSAKVSGIREWHKQFLAELLHTESGWRQIGACTADDLMFAAGARRVHAAKELHRAAQFEALAARLTDAGVETVADLPESVVRDALDAAA
jgi:hypothetical protein